MLVRLLIAVLMLAGPIPVRVCTCAAAQPSAPADLPPPSSGLAVPVSKGCGCRSESNTETQSDAGLAPSDDHSTSDAGGGHSHPDRQPHERNCPAVNPSHVVTVAIPSPAADTPTGDDLCLPLWAEPAGGVDVRVAFRYERRQSFRSVPLYISLLTLRN